VRASTSKLPRRLRAKWLWPQRQFPLSSGTQLPAGSATRESHSRWGGVVTLCRFAEPAFLPPGCRHSGTSSPRVLSFAHHNGRRS
jgi:hypothetical protein